MSTPASTSCSCSAARASGVSRMTSSVLGDREHGVQLVEQQPGGVAVLLFPAFPRLGELLAELLVVFVDVAAGRVLPQHLGELLGGEPFPAGEEEQDGDRHPLAGEVELLVVALVVVRLRLVGVEVRLGAVELERLAEHGGHGRRPGGEDRLVVAGGPVVGGLALQHPVLVLGVEQQPLHAERVLPQEVEVLGGDAERGDDFGLVLGGQVAVLVHLLAVLADPGGERGELGHQRRPAGLGREFRQRQQADRRQRVGQPERLLDVDVLVLEVIGDTVGVDVVVVVGHGVEPIGPRAGAGRGGGATKPNACGNR